MAKKEKNGKQAQDGDKATATSSSDTASHHHQQHRNRRPFERFPLHLLSNDSNNHNHNKQKQPMVVQELVPGRVLVIPEFFSRQECQEWVSFCESSGGLEYTAHPATKFIAHRECFRMQQADATVLARRIFERMKQQHPQQQLYSNMVLPMIQREMDTLYNNTTVKDYEPIGCNPNLRVYKYEKGHSFGKHVDGSNLVESSSLSGKTEWTILIYLSECQGGATRFYSDTPSARKRKNNHPSVAAFEPKVGAMLLHLHGDFCLEHEADPVLGGTKFVLRTDLVFGDPACTSM